VGLVVEVVPVVDVEAPVICVEGPTTTRDQVPDALPVVLEEFVKPVEVPVVIKLDEADTIFVERLAKTTKILLDFHFFGLSRR